MRGKEFIEYDNPFDVGMTGLLGFSSGYHAMMDCDALLMLGTDFPYRQFYPEEAQDRPDGHPGRAARPAHAGRPRARGRRRRRPLRRCCRSSSDRRTTRHLDGVARALPEGAQGVWTSWRRASRDASRSIRSTWPGCSTSSPPTTPSSRATWARPPSGRRATCTMNGQRRLLGSFNHGSMANALPQAIGAQASHPGPSGRRPVRRRRARDAAGRSAHAPAARCR